MKKKELLKEIDNLVKRSNYLSNVSIMMMNADVDNYVFIDEVYGNAIQANVVINGKLLIKQIIFNDVLPKPILVDIRDLLLFYS